MDSPHPATLPVLTLEPSGSQQSQQNALLSLHRCVASLFLRLRELQLIVSGHDSKRSCFAALPSDTTRQLHCIRMAHGVYLVLGKDRWPA